VLFLYPGAPFQKFLRHCTSLRAIQGRNLFQFILPLRISILDKTYKEEQKGNFELAEKYFTLAILEETRVAIAGVLKSFRRIVISMALF
jgi:hypothetical protein